ncbi:MAG: hypothetical protein D6761_06950 [Candidatus Dadabacteria bacterium]|nr:MAG: hypothetical protein D6761_06950 [Candidatus Dadabacteria bacterium]
MKTDQTLPIWKTLMILGAILLGVQLGGVVRDWRTLSGPDDIWWTGVDAAEPLGQAGDQCRVFIDGKELVRRLGAGDLFLKVSDETFQVVDADDVTARINHWPQVRDQAWFRLLRSSVLAAFGAGLLLAGLIGGIVGRRDRSSSPLEQGPRARS